MSNRNWQNGGKLYIPQTKPVLLNCSFTVAAADTGGLGLTGLTGPGILNVFMHTSQTPGLGNGGVTNPNPAAGTILVQLQDNYNRLLSVWKSITAPASGSDVKIDNSAMTAGVAYTITTLGNATLAKWQAIGVPLGITPAVGVSFIAASNGGTGNTLTSKVQTSAAAGSGIFSIESVGNPQLLLAPAPISAGGIGGQLIFQCRNDSASDAPAIATPADGTIISLSMYLSDSAVTVQGQ